MYIKECKVNHLNNPLGYFMPSSVFSWKVEDARGKRQKEAKVVVKKDDAIIADSGWGDLDSTSTILDIVLQPRTRYTWRVSVKTDIGEKATSEENWFETGKMDEEWQAKWISTDSLTSRHPVFSKEIKPKKKVTSARLYISGLGLYEAAWNGKKIGDEYLTPYCNNYNDWIQYQTYDVTKEIQSEGVLSITLGNGWYKGRFTPSDRTGKGYFGDEWKVIAEVRLRYEDGSEDVIGTDEEWKVSRSNIFFSNIYDGEMRDDTLPLLEKENVKIAEAPKGKLMERLSTPVKVRHELKVKEIIHTPKGETVLDMGQNMTGVFRLRVHEPKGREVKLQFGEILQDGNFYRDNLRSAKAEYVYISDGEPHLIEPKFTFYGFRYVKVSGMTEIKEDDFVALSLYSELPRTGRIETGNTKINQLISNIEWSMIDNYLDVPTDCPQRDERMGWTGDAEVFAPTACYLRDCYAFLNKYLFDLCTEQKDMDGGVPEIIPSFGDRSFSAAWGDAACIIPWTLYEFYGDKSILDRQYSSMKAWVDYISRLDGEDHGWRRHIHYGDWLALDASSPEERRGGTDIGFIADTEYLNSTRLLSKAAMIIGKTEDAEKYEAKAERILKDIREEYFTPTGRSAISTQTGLLLSLEHGLNPNKERAKSELADRFKKDGNKLRTGFVGTPILCPTLTEAGLDDIAFELLLNEGYPGWLYAVNMGATTVWERWNSVDENGKIAENGMNSLNHYAYGSILEWIYKDVLGISPILPGFRKAKLSPHINYGLKKIEGEFDSAVGKWEISWNILSNGDISYSVKVPFGATAELTLPYGGGKYELGSGEFSLSYTPNVPLCTVYSTNMPLEKLLSVPKVKEVLSRIIPQISMVPMSLQKMSIREIAKKMGGTIKEEMFEKIDALLAGI